MTADGDRDELRGFCKRVPVLIAVLVAAVIALLLVMRAVVEAHRLADAR